MSHGIWKKSLGALALAGALSLGACASEESVVKAQSTADQAMRAAQEAQATANHAVQEAQAAHITANSASQKADKASADTAAMNQKADRMYQRGLRK